MGIGSVGSDISYYGYGSTSSVKSSVQTESFSNDSSKSSGDVLSYYQVLKPPTFALLLTVLPVHK